MSFIPLLAGVLLPFLLPNASPGQADRSPLRDPLVLTLVPAGSEPDATPGGMRPADVGAQARLFLLEGAGPPVPLAPELAASCDPDVSWDGRRVLFAGLPAPGQPWNIFEFDRESRQVRQVTREATNCRSPRYLSNFYTITEDAPWDQIVFVGTLADQRDEYGGQPATSLFTCKLDGTRLDRISFNLSSDRDPAIVPDGRLIYARWSRAGFEHGVSGRVRLEFMNVDGSDRAVLAPQSPQRVQAMPCATDDGRVVFVESDRLPWDGGGTLGMVRLTRPVKTYETLTRAKQGLFRAPTALGDGGVLVSRRDASGKGRLELVRLDPLSGAISPVYRDEAHHVYQAIAVRERKRPDGRSSVVDVRDPLAMLYAMDVGISDLPRDLWPPAGEALRLRVLAGLPIPGTGGPPEAPGGAPGLAPRQILGEVPIEADGSFHLSLPGDQAIQLQVLDADGVALRSCGWIWARRHQAQGCVGCHEDPERTPPNRFVLALRKPGVSVGQDAAAPLTLDFAHDVVPIVRARCLECHAPGQSLPALGSGTGEAAAAEAALLYEQLMAGVRTDGEATVAGRFVVPGSARTSPLAWHMVGRNLARAWDDDAADRAAKPIPGEGAEGITEAERQTILRWIDLGAAWDSRPPAPHD